MDDLISRSALLDEIESLQVHITGLRSGKGVLADCMKEYKKSVLRIIDEQPTAYDAEKVVAELEEMRNEDSQGCKDVVGRKCFSYIDCGLCIMDRAIDIVRKGGVE